MNNIRSWSEFRGYQLFHAHCNEWQFFISHVGSLDGSPAARTVLCSSPSFPPVCLSFLPCCLSFLLSFFASVFLSCFLFLLFSSLLFCFLPAFLAFFLFFLLPFFLVRSPFACSAQFDQAGGDPSPPNEGEPFPPTHLEAQGLTQGILGRGWGLA